MRLGSCIISNDYHCTCVRNRSMSQGQLDDNLQARMTCILPCFYLSDGRYFKNLVLDYFKAGGENLEFRILAENNLVPEIVVINMGMKEVTILSNTFFTNFALNESVAGL